MHWTLGSPSAHALGVGDGRSGLLPRPICAIYKHFSGFEFSLLPSRVHARPSAMLRERTPFGGRLGYGSFINSKTSWPPNNLFSGRILMASVRIIGMPLGEAPQDVRRAWIGLVLPLAPGRLQKRATRPAFGVLSGPQSIVAEMIGLLLGKHVRVTGYAVSSKTALEILSKSAPEATAWWDKNAPRFRRPNQYFLFNAEACQEVDDDPSGIEDTSSV